MPLLASSPGRGADTGGCSLVALDAGRTRADMHPPVTTANLGVECALFLRRASCAGLVPAARSGRPAGAGNYKMHNKLLPFPSLREQWGIQGSANCTFCDRHRETEPHLFYYCDQVTPIWNILGTVTNRNFPYEEVVRFEFGEAVENKEAIIYLTSTTNFKIWSHRNAIKFGSQTQFSLTGILKDIFHSTKDRSKFEGTRPREPFRTQLLDLLQNYQQFLVEHRIIPDEGIT